MWTGRRLSPGPRRARRSAPSVTREATREGWRLAGRRGPVCQGHSGPRGQACGSPRLGGLWQARGAERTAVLVGGHVGWGDPRLARAPGDGGPGAREAVRRKGVGLEGRPESARPPHHCHTELPRAPLGRNTGRAVCVHGRGRKRQSRGGSPVPAASGSSRGEGRAGVRAALPLAEQITKIADGSRRH